MQEERRRPADASQAHLKLPLQDLVVEVYVLPGERLSRCRRGNARVGRVPLDEQMVQLDKAREDCLDYVARVDALLRVDRALVYSLELLVYLKVSNIEHPIVAKGISRSQLDGLQVEQQSHGFVDDLQCTQ